MLGGDKVSQAPKRDVEIVNSRGLHARAAAKFVRETAKFSSTVTVAKDGTEVDGSSIMGLLMLAAAKGSFIQISADGADADEALDALAALIASKFGETD